VRLDLPSADGKPAINGSVFSWDGKLWIVYRYGWENARLVVAGLDERLQVAGVYPVRCGRRKEDSAGKEDPRFFTFGGEPYVAYTGLDVSGPALVTHQCFARLKPVRNPVTREVTRWEMWPTYAPAIRPRQFWEKNWAFFEVEGGLFAVYSVRPHRVALVAEEIAHVVADTPGMAGWEGWELRGGAAPVRVGDEFWHFFHAVREGTLRREYRVGLYAFDARPPFGVTRVVPGPVLAPRPEEHPHQHAPGGPPNVVYPCGALRRGGRWLLSYGYFDREVRVTELEHAGLERALVPATFRHYHHAIDGWSADFEPLYARMVKEARDGAHFVEVGVWRGRSLSFLAMECRNAGKRIRLDGVDSWRGGRDAPWMQETAAREDVMADARRNVDRSGYPVNLIRGASAEVAATYPDASLDFVFIDDDHTYPGVRASISAWLLKLRPGATMAGHDYGDGNDVGRAVAELLPGFSAQGSVWTWRKVE
jgi:predicted GH43/DUF377 family glycosyl hydrolase